MIGDLGLRGNLVLHTSGQTTLTILVVLLGLCTRGLGSEVFTLDTEDYGTFNSDVPSKPHRLRSGYYVMTGREKGKIFDVKGGEVTKITAGAPLTAAISVTQSAGTVQLNLLARDASGARVSSLYGPKGKPPVPKVTIYDDKRKEVYSTSLKYG